MELKDSVLELVGEALNYGLSEAEKWETSFLEEKQKEFEEYNTRMLEKWDEYYASFTPELKDEVKNYIEKGVSKESIIKVMTNSALVLELVANIQSIYVLNSSLTEQDRGLFGSFN